MQLQELHTPFDRAYTLDLIDEYRRLYPAAGNTSILATAKAALVINDDNSPAALEKAMRGIRKMCGAVETAGAKYKINKNKEMVLHFEIKYRLLNAISTQLEMLIDA
jgi:hypothetical protein